MRYLVRVWINDIEVEADNATEAEDKARELVDKGNINVLVEYAEVQRKLVDGQWRYTSREE